MGPYRNNTNIQEEDVLRVKLNRHNIHNIYGNINISKNVNILHTSQYFISYYHHKSNYNNTSVNNKNNVTTSGTLFYIRPLYNIIQPVTMPNYTGIQQPVCQFGFNYNIHTARKVGFVDKLKDYYTKRRLVAMFQIKGNYLLLKEIIIMYFNMYYKVLVYEERSLKEALNKEMNEYLSLIELDGREVIVRLCEPFQLVRNDILPRKISLINSEFEMNSREITPNKDDIKQSILKVTKWLMDLENAR